MRVIRPGDPAPQVIDPEAIRDDQIIVGRISSQPVLLTREQDSGGYVWLCLDQSPATGNCYSGPRESFDTIADAICFDFLGADFHVFDAWADAVTWFART